MLNISADLSIRPNGEGAGFVAFSPVTRRFEPLSGDEVTLVAAFPRSGLDRGEIPSSPVARLGFDWAPCVDRLARLGMMQSTTSGAVEPTTTGKIPVYLYHPLNEYGSELQFLIPLSLGLVLESARVWEDGTLTKDYDFHVPLMDSPVRLLEAIERRGPGIVLFSDYVWTAAENIAVSAALKALYPGCITMHGGPSVPKYEEVATKWLREHPHVDIAVRGEGEITAAEILDGLRGYFQKVTPARGPEFADLEPLAEVLGQTFAWTEDGQRSVRRVADRPRLQEPGNIPSPFVSGFFDGVNNRPWTLGVIETNRGCPYGCTYCDWGSATLQKIYQYPLDRLRAEIAWHGRRQINTIFLADANFGILPRDTEVAQLFADAKRAHDFPRSIISNYAKNGSSRLGEIFSLWTDAGLTFDAQISIQTIAPQVLADVRRSNIKTERYLELSDLFDGMRLRTVIQLMLALPGATLESTCLDIEKFFLRDQECQLFLTQMLPNAPMSDPAYMKKYKIVSKNNHIVSCYSFTEDDWRTMSCIGTLYRILGAWRILGHYLVWLHLEHGIGPVAAYIRNLVADLDGPGLCRFPAIEALLRPLISVPAERMIAQTPPVTPFIENGWEGLLEEFQEYTAARFGVPRSSAADVVMTAQQAVLPRAGRKYPFVVELPHDLDAFFRDSRDGSRTEALSGYGPGLVTVHDPLHRSDTVPATWLTSLFPPPSFELPSNLRDKDETLKKRLGLTQEELRDLSRPLPVAQVQ